MKIYRNIFIGLLIVLIGTAFCSCSDDDEYLASDTEENVIMKFVTVVPDGPESYFLVEDDGTTYFPTTNSYIYEGFNPNEKQWAQIFFTLTESEVRSTSHNIKLVSLFRITTKPLAADKGESENNRIYGNDPIKGVGNSKNDLWYGGGYLNIVITSYNTKGEKEHSYDLVRTDDPYTFEFRHNAYGAPRECEARMVKAFDLKSFPDTKGETVDLTIIFNTVGGKKESKVAYNSEGNLPNIIP